MKRLLTIILLLISVSIFGQNKIKTYQADTSSTGFLPKSNLLPTVKAQSTGIFDSQTTPILTGYTTNVAVAYGTIQIYPSATKAFNLRRASDGATQDFYFDSHGKVPLEVLNAFIGMSKGYVTTWYDQSGNGINAVQATVTLQPYVIVENGIIKIRFENKFSGTAGEGLTYTLGSAINVNNTTVYCAYANNLANGNDQINVTPNFTSRYFLSTANHKLDLFIDGADATKPNALKLNATSTSTLYGWGHANFWAINSNGSGSEIRSNYSSVTEAAQSSFTETVWEIGNKNGSNTNPFSGDIYAYIQYSAAQPTATIDSLSARFKVPYQLIAPSDNTLSIVNEGDSETAGAGTNNNQNPPNQLYYKLKIPFINLAVSGNTYALQNGTNFNTAIYGCIVGGKTNILFQWGGTNDVTNGGLTQTVAYNANVTYAQNAHTAGFSKVVALTALDRGGVNFFSTLNADLIANTTDFDAVIQEAEDPRLIYYAGFGGSTTALARPDYNYFNADNVHLVNNGCTVVASYENNYLNTLTSTNALTKSLQRDIETLKAQVSTLLQTAVYNNSLNFTPNWRLPGNLQTDTLYGSYKPLSNLHILSNKAQVANINNYGNILLGENGTSQQLFGQTAAIGTSTVYSFGYTPSSNFGTLRMDLYNQNSTNTFLRFVNNGATDGNNFYLEAPIATLGSGLIFALKDLSIQSSQGAIDFLMSGGTDHPFYVKALQNIGGSFYNLISMGYSNTAPVPTSFVEIQPSNGSTTGLAPFKIDGSTLATVQNYAIEPTSTNLYWTDGSTNRVSLNQQSVTTTQRGNLGFVVPYLLANYSGSAGSGYTSNPSVSVTGGAGTGATATCVETSGVVVSVTITAAGTGYTSPVSLVFSGGGGTGGTLTGNAKTISVYEGLKVYDNTLHTPFVYNGASWVANGTIEAHTPSAINSTATATAAQMASGYITTTSAAAETITTSTATALATQINAIQGTQCKITIDNTAGANTDTLALGTGFTLLPIGSSSLTVPSGTTGVGTWLITFVSTTAATISRVQ